MLTANSKVKNFDNGEVEERCSGTERSSGSLNDRYSDVYKYFDHTTPGSTQRSEQSSWLLKILPVPH